MAIGIFAASTPPDAQLTDRLTYRALHNCGKMAVVATAHLAVFTPHSERAGWASVRCFAGQPFTEAQEDGRWRIPAVLRGNLEAVAAVVFLASPSMAHRAARLKQLDATLYSWRFL